MTEDQIKHMADRFLGWKLHKDCTGNSPTQAECCKKVMDVANRMRYQCAINVPRCDDP